MSDKLIIYTDASLEKISSGLQVKQVKSAVVSIFLPIILFLCFFGSGQAAAIERPQSMDNVFKRHFFNMDYVRQIWATKSSDKFDQLMEETAFIDGEGDPAEPAYNTWDNLDLTDPAQADAFLQDSPYRQKIMNNHDLNILYQHWWELYKNWRSSKKVLEYEDFSDFAKVGYNQCDAGHAFAMCGPLPDWRNKANRKNEMKKRINRMANKVYWIKSGCKIAEDIKKKSECAPVRKYHALLKKACLPIMKPAFPFSTVGPEAEVCVD